MPRRRVLVIFFTVAALAAGASGAAIGIASGEGPPVAPRAANPAERALLARVLKEVAADLGVAAPRDARVVPTTRSAWVALGGGELATEQDASVYLIQARGDFVMPHGGATNETPPLRGKVLTLAVHAPSVLEGRPNVISVRVSSTPDARYSGSADDLARLGPVARLNVNDAPG